MNSLLLNLTEGVKNYIIIITIKQYNDVGSYLYHSTKNFVCSTIIRVKFEPSIF